MKRLPTNTGQPPHTTASSAQKCDTSAPSRHVEQEVRIKGELIGSAGSVRDT